MSKSESKFKKKTKQVLRHTNIFSINALFIFDLLIVIFFRTQKYSTTASIVYKLHECIAASGVPNQCELQPDLFFWKEGGARSVFRAIILKKLQNFNNIL